MFTLNSSFVQQGKFNTKYNRPMKIGDVITFKKAILNDHIMATFTSPDVRRKECFVSCDVLYGDIDNEKATCEEEFITLDDIKAAFHDVEVWIATSKSHMIEKDGAAARPKFHLYFPMGRSIDNADEFEGYLRKLITSYSYLHFDEACKNCNRIFFATLPTTQITVLKGHSILEELEKIEDKPDHDEFKDYAISVIAETKPKAIKNSVFDESVGLSDGRKKALYRYACSCKARGMEDNEIIQECQRLNATFNPPHTNDIVLSAANNAIQSPTIHRGRKNQTMQERIADIKNDKAIQEPDKVNAPWDYIAYWCAYFDKTYAWVAMGKQARIVCRIEEHVSTPARTPQIFLESALPPNKRFVIVQNNTTSTEEDGQPKTRTIDVVKYWLDHTTHYKGMMFAPGIEGDVVQGPEAIYNNFKGFNFTNGEYDPKDADLFLDHLENSVCRGNQELFTFLDAWFADIIQNPDKKNGVAVAVRGQPGSGKSTIFEIFSLILGEAASEFTRMSDLTCNFNAAIAEKLLCYVDDSRADDKTDLNVLKNIITSPTVLVERKGVDKYKDNNFARIAVTSNEIDVIHLEDNDRRWALIDMGNLAPDMLEARKAHLEYLNNFYRGRGTPETNERHMRALYWHWKNLDISKVDWKKIPETDARRMAKEFNQPFEVQFVIDCAWGQVKDSINIFSLDDNEVSVSEYKERLRAWMDLHQIKKEMPIRMKETFEMYFGKFFLGYNKGGIARYRFNKEAIKVAFESQVNGDSHDSHDLVMVDNSL